MKKQKLGGVLAPLFPTVNSLRPVCGQKLSEMERPLSAEHREIQQTSGKIGSVSKIVFKSELHVKREVVLPSAAPSNTKYCSEGGQTRLKHK